MNNNISFVCRSKHVRNFVIIIILDKILLCSFSALLMLFCTENTVLNNKYSLELNFLSV